MADTTMASSRYAPQDAPRVVTAYDTATAEDVGKLILRLTLAVLLLMHGVGKLLNGIDPISEMLVANGLPAELAYGAYIGEVLAPMLLILGFWTRPAALLIAVNMVFAIGLAHANEVFALGKQGGWALELQGFYLFSAIAVALMGAGALSVGGARGRGN